jgi:hypothetical protein
MNPRRSKHKSTVPRFCAFFLAQRRESTKLDSPVYEERAYLAAVNFSA